MRNGEPFFPIGAFGVPKRLAAPRKAVPVDLDMLRRVGWNTVLTAVPREGQHEKTLAILDEYHKHGLAVILYIQPIVHDMILKEGMGPDGWDENPGLLDEHKQRLGKLIDTYKNHPAILGYYTFDEPENYFYAHPDFKALREAQQQDNTPPDLGAFIAARAAWVKETIRKHDPNPEHYVFAVIGWWDHYDKLSEALVDVNLPNEYPTGRGRGEFGGTSELILHDACQAAAGARQSNGMGFVYVPWGCNNMSGLGKNWRLSTLREFRYAAFAPMTQGAMGCLYWAGYRSWEPYAIKTLFPVQRELADLTPYWLGEWHDEALTLETDQPGLQIVHKRYSVPALAGCVRKADDGSYLVLVVNNLEMNVFANVALDLPDLPAQAHDRLASESPFAVRDGTLRLPMEPLGVRALIINPAKK